MPEALSPESQKILASNFGVSVSQLPAIIEAAQKKEAAKDQQVSYQTDIDGNVTAIVFDKNTGEFKTNSLGGIAKGESTRFQAVTDPITGAVKIFDPIRGEFVNGGKGGVPNFNLPTQPGQPGKVVISANTANTPKNLRDNCVLFARSIVPDLPVGLVTAEQKRAMINTTSPTAGAVAMMPTFGDPKIGHTAVVESVNQDGTVTIVESNVRSGPNGKEISRRTGTPQQLGIEGYWAGKAAKASNYTTPKTSQGESINGQNTYPQDVPGQMSFERVLAKGGSVDFKQGYATYLSETGAESGEQAYQDYSKRYYDAQSNGLDYKANDISNLPASAKDNVAKVNTALRSLSEMEKILADGGQGARYVNPSTPLLGALQQATPYEISQNLLVENVGRLQSGGAINSQEMENFKSLLPTPADKDPTIRSLKLSKAKAFLEDKLQVYGMADQGAGQTNDNDPLGLGGSPSNDPLGLGL
jgi:hypothetical protein